MRSEGGLEKRLSSGEVGWLYPIDGAEPRPRPVRYDPPPEPSINAAAIMREWWKETTQSQIRFAAAMLGVSAMSLGMLGMAYSREYKALAFPMMDGRGHTVGIRLRAANGAKFAVRGSHQGIFLPRRDPGRVVLVCEGPSDSAAGLTLGFHTIGRPSCSGGQQDVISAINRLGVERSVIIADNDVEQELEKGRNPGVAGAKALADIMPVPCAIVVLPSKDLRAFLQLGGTKDLLNSIINSCVWRQPTRV